MDCLFCKIAQGGLPSAELWQDEHAFAFLDINPLAPGHALVVPKAHARLHEEMDGASRNAVWDGVARLRSALCAAVGAQGATIAVNDGAAAGQEVAHCHVHIIPRREGDAAGPVHALFKHRPQMSPNELHDIAVHVQQSLSREAPA